MLLCPCSCSCPYPVLDGSGHESAEIDGTVERHVTSAPTKQPVPAPRQSGKSSVKADFRLDLQENSPSAKPNDDKARTSSVQSIETQIVTEQSIAKSKIPVKVKETVKEIVNDSIINENPTTMGTKNEQEAKVCKTVERTVVVETKSSSKLPVATTMIDGALDSEKSIVTKHLTNDVTDHAFTDRSIDGITKIVTTVTSTSGTKFGSQEIEREVTDSMLTASGGEIGPEELRELMNDGTMTIKRTTTIVSGSSLPPELEELSHAAGPTKTVTITNSVRPITEIDSQTTGSSLTGTIVKETIDRSRSMMKDGAGWTTETIVTKRSSDGRNIPWESVRRSREDQEQWEAQFSLDTSPGSGNGDMFTKNGDSRHEINSDTDSEGSPRQRRRSLSKRRTLGSSSGSDVALHEGAELSPMEDDQGTSFTANILSKRCTYPANLVSSSYSLFFIIHSSRSIISSHHIYLLTFLFFFFSYSPAMKKGSSFR